MPGHHVQPANPRASVDARKVLAYLHDLPARPDKRLLLGQNLWHYPGGIAGGYTHFLEALAAQTEKWLPLIEMPYDDPSDGSDLVATANQVAIDYWNAGGLVSLFINPRNPWTGGTSTDLTGREQIANLLNPGTSEHRVWMAKLDAMAAGLTALRDAGVVVLWRPLHEMTFIQCYWYDHGATGDGEAYKHLWRHMFRYFSEEKALDNLLWVYAAADVEWWGGPAADSMYPGGDYADIVGVDVYAADLKRPKAYAALTALGKPFALTEVGPGHSNDPANPVPCEGLWDNLGLLDTVKHDHPATVYALYWHSWPGAKMALIDNLHAGEMLADPWSVSRDEIAWRK